MASLIGQSLERYQIVGLLGEGGMAAVYKAFDTRLERFVAVKVIRTDQFAPAMLDEMLKRFEREAKALAQLSHPNIVHVHDYGEHAGAPYLVMEYLPSGTLNQRSRLPMPWQQAVYTLLPITQALAYAHEHNVIHRDIKPGNILLTEKGQPMLSDFGIAKILGSGGTATLTGAGMTIGTPEYMAPEQWNGQADARSDIYSLGVVLYELVTGHKPYTADTPASILLKQANEPLAPPRQFVPGLPEGLEQVLFKALGKRPEDRYQSMNEFAAALDTLSGGRTLLSEAAAEADLPGKTVLASGVGRSAAGLAAGAGSTPVVPIPPGTRRPAKPIRWSIWVPIGVLVVLVCVAALFGAGPLVRGLKGAGLFAGLARNTSVSTPAATVPQSTSPAQTDPLASQGALGPTPPGAQVKVLWDIWHGPWTTQDGTPFTPDGMYKSLTQALADRNIIITSGGLTNLDSYSILVLAESSGTKPFTSQEVDQIEQFVRASGHGLLILSDTPEFQNLADAVSRRFSIGLGELTSSGPASYSSEPFFTGVNSIQFVDGGGVFQVASPAQIAAVDQNGNSLIAFCECDPGRVLAVGDANLFDNRGLSLADNQRFALNAFEWLAKLSP